MFTSPTLFPLLTIVKIFLVKSQNKTTLIVQIHCVCDPYYIQYIHYSQQKHPQFPLEESSMPQSKKDQQKVATLEKTTFLYRSNTLICLCPQLASVGRRLQYRGLFLRGGSEISGQNMTTQAQAGHAVGAAACNTGVHFQMGEAREEGRA